jgi:hypothetical protein
MVRIVPEIKFIAKETYQPGKAEAFPAPASALLGSNSLKALPQFTGSLNIARP